jgi:hypothetical protein
MAKTIQEQTYQALGELPSQQYDTTPGAFGEFAPLEALQSLGGGSQLQKQLKAQELAQYGQDPTAALQLAKGQLDIKPYSQQLSQMRIPVDMSEPMQPSAIPLQVPSEQPQPMRAPTAQEFKAQEQVEKDGMQEALKGYQEGAFQVGRQKGMMDELEAQTKAYAEKQKANQEAIANAQLKVQQIEAEAGKIEPQDFWANKSTGSRIAAAIAMGVGAYASAMTGGPNTAKQIIDGAIQQDLALQKEKYLRAKERGATARNAYGDLVAKLGSEEAASAAMVNNAYRMINTKLQIQESQAQNAERAMRIQSLRGDIEKSRMEVQAKQIEQLARLEAMKGAGQQEAPVPRGVLSDKDEEKYIRDSEFFGFAPTREEAMDFRKTLPGYRSTMKDLNRLFEIAKKPGKSLNPVLEDEVKAISQRLVGGGLKDEILGPGTIQEKERELVLNDVLGNPTKLLQLDAGVKAKLKSLVDSMEFRKGEQAKILGLQTKMRPSPLTRVTIEYQGQAGPITKDVTPQEAEVYERNAKARNIPFKRLTP